ncbi:hypothetical protein [Streptomyces sp. NPDC005752]|uniref:hypothetical protein n=1 Tax=Streptomyces sp. NPDC005752 TaxID=3157065 RepID=UPI0033E9BCBF
MSLALVALLSTAGCVSVPAEGARPAPAASSRSGHAPAAQASREPVAPPAVHDVLGETDERQERASGKKRKGGGTGAADAVAPPARQEVRQQPRRVTPARPEPPRRAGTPRRAQQRKTYDMRTVCASGRGVASAEIVALCRTTYGR